MVLRFDGRQSYRVADEVIEKQLADPRRLLIGGVVADSRQRRDTVIRMYEFGRAFRSYVRRP